MDEIDMHSPSMPPAVCPSFIHPPAVARCATSLNTGTGMGTKRARSPGPGSPTIERQAVRSLSLPCDRVASSNVYLLGRNEFHLQGMRTMQHAICPTFWVCSTRSPCLCHIASLTTSTSTGVWHSIQERRDRTTGCGKQGSSVCAQGLAETRLGTRAMVFMVRIWYVVSLLARTNRGCHGSEEYS